MLGSNNRNSNRLSEKTSVSGLFKNIATNRRASITRLESLNEQTRRGSNPATFAVETGMLDPEHAHQRQSTYASFMTATTDLGIANPNDFTYSLSRESTPESSQRRTGAPSLSRRSKKSSSGSRRTASQHDTKNGGPHDAHARRPASKVWGGYDVETSASNLQKSNKIIRIKPVVNLSNVHASGGRITTHLLTPRTRYARIAGTLEKLPPERTNGVSALVREENVRQRQQLSYEETLTMKRMHSQKHEQKLLTSKSAGLLGKSKAKRTANAFKNIENVMDELDSFGWRKGWFKDNLKSADLIRVRNEKLMRERAQAWMSKRKAGKKSEALHTVETKLGKYRNNERELKALHARVKAKEKKRRAKFENTTIMTRNKNIASSVDIRASEQEKIQQRDASWAEKAKQKRAILERLQQKKQEQLIMERKGAEPLVNLPPKERERRIKFQQKWLKLIQLMARISQQESRVSSVMERRIRQETELWMVAHIDNNQRLALIEQVNKNRSRVMKFIFDKMTIWIKRIRWRIQRRKAMEVWRFLTIAKNIHFMRICIRKNSYRSKVLKIQMWWKQKIETVDSPSLIIQVKWAAREAFLIEQYNEFRFNKRSDKLAEKKRRKTSILVKGSSRGKSGLSKLSPKKKRKDMKKLEPILVEEVPKPREVTRYEALHLELTTGQVEGDDEAEFLKHKVPAPFRRAAIAKYLAEERELDRAEFKKYMSDTLRFKQDHHFKLMELQQRAKLGLDDEGWMKTHAPQIPYKSIFNLPSNTYLDALILNAQHKWVLSMAQSKLDAFSKPLRTEYAAAPSSEPSLASTTTNQPLSKILE